eukprot:CAMPEP_0196572580 /NCGR_PEP_ID=MMETSP1081-20130531/2603_1 /TAXON_ID=36882 /ORGANISM="Pyramimonas amylifera, Strain CCMP720" /LENGTH=204 /DNA_ID=CAMNT_0041889941 /DNA_START=116 /DNA_END=730 /DNA_ORIENTATION=+
MTAVMGNSPDSGEIVDKSKRFSFISANQFEEAGDFSSDCVVPTTPSQESPSNAENKQSHHQGKTSRRDSWEHVFNPGRNMGEKMQKLGSSKFDSIVPGQESGSVWEIINNANPSPILGAIPNEPRERRLSDSHVETVQKKEQVHIEPAKQGRLSSGVEGDVWGSTFNPGMNSNMKKLGSSKFDGGAGESVWDEINKSSAKSGTS